MQTDQPSLPSIGPARPIPSRTDHPVHRSPIPNITDRLPLPSHRRPAQTDQPCRSLTMLGTPTDLNPCEPHRPRATDLTQPVLLMSTRTDSPRCAQPRHPWPPPTPTPLTSPRPSQGSPSHPTCQVSSPARFVIPTRCRTTARPSSGRAPSIRLPSARPHAPCHPSARLATSIRLHTSQPPSAIRTAPTILTMPPLAPTDRPAIPNLAPSRQPRSPRSIPPRLFAPRFHTSSHVRPPRPTSQASLSDRAELVLPCLH